MRHFVTVPAAACTSDRARQTVVPVDDVLALGDDVAAVGTDLSLDLVHLEGHVHAVAHRLHVRVVAHDVPVEERVRVRSGRGGEAYERRVEALEHLAPEGVVERWHSSTRTRAKNSGGRKRV